MDDETGNRKTWPNMKQDFTEARQELRNTYARVDELGFHSASAIVAQIVEQLRDIVLTDNVKPSPDFQPSPPPDYPPEAPPLPPFNPSNINIDINNSIQTIDLVMATPMATMMANMEAMRLRIEGNKSGQR